MIESILRAFEIWTDAQGIKSKGRVKSIDNIKFEGISRLRELILDLAIRGKLIPQNEIDEPANELLKRIEIEKRRLIVENSIGKTGNFLKVDDDKLPFNLPPSWEWTSIRNIGHDWGQKTPAEDFTYIDVSAIDNKSGEITNPTIIKANDAPSRARKIIKKGTVIYSTVRPYLKNICVINEDYNPQPIASTAFAIIHPYLQMPSKYFYYFFRSPFFINYVESVQTGIAYPAINDRQFFEALVPLPPLEEQKRIIEKVDELLTLCDRLEEQQAVNLTTHHHLVKSLLETLLNAANADELQAAWEKLSEHFNILFCTEDSIEQLKGAILQLAIMGKLVKQDPNDEPASKLFIKIANEKEILVKKGELRKPTVLPEITEENKKFKIPFNWHWCRLEDLVSILGDGIHGTPNYDDNGNYYFVNGNNLNNGLIEIKPDTKTVLELEYHKHKRNLNERTVLVSINGTIGNTAFYNNEKLILGKSACYFNLMNGINKDYIRLLLNTSYFLEYALLEATGTTIKNVSLKTMRSLIIPLPPFDEQEKIVDAVSVLFKLCDELLSKILKSGEIKVLLSKTVIELI